MTLFQQIMWGSLYLGACFVVEILLLVWCTQSIRRLSVGWRRRSLPIRTGGVISLALVFIVVAHTVQVWIWAGAWILSDVLPDWNTAIYFSMVTYTTVGYGDVVLGPNLRIFGTFASIAGLLAFGLSTAYLVAILSRLLERHAGRR